MMSTLILLLAALAAPDDAARLESAAIRVEVVPNTGAWSILDKAAGVRWPAEGRASIALEGAFHPGPAAPDRLRLERDDHAAVIFSLVDEGRSLEIRFEGQDLGDLRLLHDALNVTDRDGGAVIVPSREGLLLPADSGVAFKHGFGTSEYEGCHMNMLGLLKGGTALIVSWDSADVWPEIQSKLTPDQSVKQTLTTALTLKKTARALRLTPLGKGDWNTIAAGYRRIAEAKGLAVTMRQKIARNPHAERCSAQPT